MQDFHDESFMRNVKANLLHLVSEKMLLIYQGYAVRRRHQSNADIQTVFHSQRNWKLDYLFLNMISIYW